MFENPGNAVKNICKALFWIIAVIGVIVMIILGKTLRNNGWLIGILFLVVTCCVAYLSVILIYAFGELVENYGAERNSLRALERQVTELDKKLELLSAAEQRNSGSKAPAPAAPVQERAETPVGRSNPAAPVAAANKPDSASGTKWGINPKGLRAVYPEIVNDYIIRCPVCKTAQSNSRVSCSKCGIDFMSIASGTAAEEPEGASGTKWGINPKGLKAVYPITLDDKHVKCPECGGSQPSDRKVCWKCGVPFMYTEE